MKPRKHKRKESFSILLVSNTGQNSRQFHISRSLMRLCTVFVLLVCATFGWLMYQYLSGGAGIGIVIGQSLNRNTTEPDEELLEKLAAQEEQMRKLEEEKEALSNQNNTLTAENKALLEAAKTSMAASSGGGDSSEEEGTDDSVPSRYPYSEQGDVSAKYSAEHPYISIDTQNEGNVVSAGDGKISMIGSDDTYPLIIEITHVGDYKTRYMLPQEAESLFEEGADVRTGDSIVLLDEQNVQLDYQVIFEEQPIDPLIVFEAKG